MVIQRRWFFDERINVGNGHQDLDGSVRQSFRNRKLVQIARIIVVYRAPEQVPEITRRCLGSRRRAVDSVQLGERLGRKIRNESSLEHRPVGNPLQDRAVLFVVCARHMCHPFWNAPLWFLAQ